MQRPEPEDFLCDESFLRFCEGEKSAKLFWEKWVREHHEYAAAVEKALRLYDVLNAGQGNREVQLAAMKDALVRRERFEQLINGGSSGAKVVKMNGKPWMRYAAAAAFILSATTLGYQFFSEKQPVEAPVLLSYEYATAEGAHKTIMLPDSSVIMLNANSHLSVNRNFDSEHREVTITGEAFFDIKHDEQHPFIVHTSEYRIRVLGTTFNVKSHPGEATETDLVSGKVEIVTNDGAHPKNSVILQPNEKFVLQRKPAINHTLDAVPAKGVVTKLKLDTLSQHASETAWARQKMEINDERLDVIAAKLQTWYGIEVIFKDEEVKQYRYTAAFNDETIFKVLQYLQQSYPFSYRIENDAIIISRS
ncbi:FecR family protein [uncultured Chitinophaga sp.]|uniref:FecR family protein n=1 Tax=uncultured Chitinophaga sp. TaxID=339340 RepID=UPI0025D06542|nr:FecR domain-containing protein [uncultured Chitinophaga sp.]